MAKDDESEGDEQEDDELEAEQDKAKAEGREADAEEKETDFGREQLNFAKEQFAWQKEQAEKADKERGEARAAEEAKRRKEKRWWRVGTKRKSEPAHEGVSGKGIGGARWIPVILSIIVVFFDFYLGFGGFRIGIQLRRFAFGGFSFLAPTLAMGWTDYLIGIFLNPVFWALAVFFIITNMSDRRKSFSWILLIYLFMVIFFGGGWKGSGLMHIIMAILFYVLVLGPFYEEDKPKARYMLALFLFIDYFLYGIVYDFVLIDNDFVKGVLANRLIIPIWFYVSIFYAYKIRPSILTAILITGIILVNVFSVYGGVVDIKDFSKAIDPQQKEEFKNYFQRSSENFKNWVGELFTGIKKSAEQQLEYATGGYYNGVVEENQDPKNQLGVYLDDIEAADNKFYQNERVVVWGDLRAKTLDNPVKVKLSCKAGDIPGEIKPKSEFNISSEEQNSFECIIGAGRLETGTNAVSIIAEFNFETLAYLKTYFMDIERIRALRRENVDPLLEYGVIDRKPIAAYTNGPVRLGIGTVDPPLGVSNENEGYSYIGVTVENQWQGKINNVTGVIIQLPSNIELEKYDNDKDFCRGTFKYIREEEGYKIYEITGEGIREIKTPIDQYKSWRCSIKIPKGKEALGDTPVTTYYYRAGVEYFYEIEERINLQINNIPEEKTQLGGCDDKCTDTDGCVCEADGCNMPKGESIGEKFTCNNYYGGCENRGREPEEDIAYIEANEEYVNAMIKLNNLCIANGTDEINNELDADKTLSEEEKENLRNFVMPGCEQRSYMFFEITEGLIVERVGCSVNIFQVLENKFMDLSDGQKEKAKTKKEGSIKLIDEVIVHFNETHAWVTDIRGSTIEDAQGYKTELQEGVNFG